LDNFLLRGRLNVADIVAEVWAEPLLVGAEGRTMSMGGFHSAAVLEAIALVFDVHRVRAECNVFHNNFIDC
jgi:hypothetical protein